MAASIFGSGPQVPSSGVATPDSSSSSRNDAEAEKEGIHQLQPNGDIVLQVEHRPGSLLKFRVDSTALKKSSRYFERLLQPGRFGEGNTVEEQRGSLKARYKSASDVPSSELPVVTVQDLGRISVKSVATLLLDFLSILHGKDTQGAPLVANLANLVVVGDRFDALDTLRAYVKRRKMVRSIDGKTTAKAEGALSDERVRQRVLVALMLDDPTWLEKYSLRIMVKGWTNPEPDLSSGMWWDLPSRLEDELDFRRECILETIQSLQDHFLRLYSSRERQCKLGYDSSAQCDSFQLGEMIRFFRRMNTLTLQGTIIDTANGPDAYTGDVLALLESLRQVPEYQIDRNHNHCGIRTRIIPLLDIIQMYVLHTGVCLDCWNGGRAEYAWIEAKKPLLWKQTARVRTNAHKDRHADVRALFMAAERDWS